MNYKGLNNQGATCYMNSLLQTLFMTPEFRSALYNWEFKGNDPHESIPLQLQLLFARLQNKSSSETYIDTKRLIGSFLWDPSEAFQQHDVQEFCRVLFSAIEESCKNESFISDLYGGTIIGYVKCLNCGNTSEKIESFMDLSITVRELYTNIYNDTLEKGLKSYLTPEFLSLDNQYYCEICNKKVDAEKGVKLDKLPIILTFQLNRFELDFQTFQRKKLNNKVIFPFYLDMNNFLKPGNEIQINQIYPFYEKIKNSCPEIRDFNIKTNKIASNTMESMDSNTNINKIDLKRKAKDDFTQEKPEKIQKLDMNIGQSISFLKQAKEDISEIMKKKSKILFKKIEIVDNIDDDPLFGTKNIFANETIEENLNIKIKENTDIDIDKDIELSKILEEIEKEKEKYNNIPNCYELYSIMVHSGGALGGHYYTYIRNFENQWLKFNDRIVSKMSLMDLKKSFGDEQCTYNTGTSAYMLFYRLINKEKNHLISIPERLLNVIETEIKEDLKIKEIEEKIRQEKANQLTIRVFHLNKEKTFIFSKNDIFLNLIEQVETEFSLPNNRINWRIRAYSLFEDLMTDSYTNKENFTFEELKIKNFKSFIIEYKFDNEVFIEYDPNKIELKICLWKEGINSLEEKELKPFKILISQNAILEELIIKIEENTGIPKENICLIRRNQIISKGFSEKINKNIEDLKKDLHKLKIFNGLMIFVEDIEGLWDKEFDLDKHRILIKFNNPDEDNYNNTITIDSRLTFLDLKTRISSELKISSNDFLMKRDSKLGLEYKDLHLNLNGKLLSYSRIYIESGKPSSSNEFRLSFSLANKKITDTITHDYTELFTMCVSDLWNVNELKIKLIQEFNNRNLKINQNPLQIRLRERVSDKLGQILRNENLLNQYSLFDRKAISIQELDYEEIIDKESVLLEIKLWDFNNFELTESIEFLAKKRESLIILAEKIGNFFNFPANEVEACKINNLWCFDRTQLLNEQWIILNDYSGLLIEEPWFCGRDGTLIIIKRRNEKINIQDKDLIEKAKIFQNNNKKNKTTNNNNSLIPKEKALKIRVRNKSEDKIDKDENKKKLGFKDI